ncbi:unnamed protein product [Fraxinus pennsylvanica]|uniref:Protein kinase domain-containing protein n=1 Tax=Fraxinus pennsylvanica TaxID=56036 RepID=A0AAD2DMD3_9LAMI|nr:unnamed protein product [Fraxinus pennsylvanica]
MPGSQGNMGTYRWMAPEMIEEKPYTRKVDVYSFGIVQWELTTALLPFLGMTPVQAAFAVVEKNERPPLAANCQPALVHLMKRCWVANHSKRPDFSDIVSALETYDECVTEVSQSPTYSSLRVMVDIELALVEDWEEVQMEMVDLVVVDKRNKDPDDVDQDPVHIDPPPKSPSDSSSDGGGGWSFGGLIKTFMTQSESVLETYRRDLREFRSGLRKESEVIREVAATL